MEEIDKMDIDDKNNIDMKEKLPTEIVCQILSNISNITDLARCGLVSRKWLKIVTARMYKDVDMRLRKYDIKYTNANLGQEKLLRTLHENPHLASLVNTFKTQQGSVLRFKATDVCRQQATQSITQNMTSLKVLLAGDCRFSAHIMNFISQLPELRELSVSATSPRNCTWRMWSTKITKIYWRVLPEDLKKLLQLLENTCPLPETLDIGIISNPNVNGSSIYANDCNCYQCDERRAAPVFMSATYHLEHLHTVRVTDLCGMQIPGVHFKHICCFVKRHERSIQSFSVPVAGLASLTVCPILGSLYLHIPNLKSFAWTKSEVVEQYSDGTPLSRFFLRDIVFHHHDFEHHRVNVVGVTLPESARLINRRILGRLATYNTLRELRLNTLMNESDEKIILWMQGETSFILGLPQTLQVLRIKITPTMLVRRTKLVDFVNGNYSSKFKALRCLNTLDISVHQTNATQQTGYRLPRIASHWRRLPYDTRLDYNDTYADVSKPYFVDDSTTPDISIAEVSAPSQPSLLPYAITNTNPTSNIPLHSNENATHQREFSTEQEIRNHSTSNYPLQKDNNMASQPQPPHHAVDPKKMKTLWCSIMKSNGDIGPNIEHSYQALRLLPEAEFEFDGTDAIDGIWRDKDVAGVIERQLNCNPMKAWPDLEGLLRDMAVCCGDEEEVAGVH